MLHAGVDLHKRYSQPVAQTPLLGLRLLKQAPESVPSNARLPLGWQSRFAGSPSRTAVSALAESGVATVGAFPTVGTYSERPTVRSALTVATGSPLPYGLHNHRDGQRIGWGADQLPVIGMKYPGS